jgi:predicted HD superfamily hydrolase involved in NAD metabolism
MPDSFQTSPVRAESVPIHELHELRQWVLDWLAVNVPSTRLNHILRVETICHGLNVEQATQAGLMHDLAKYFQPQRLLDIAKAEGLELDPILIANPHLIHADVSAIVAQHEFGVQNEEILAAIRNHTLGQPGMSSLSCVVYLADSLEPGRGSHPTLDTLRTISYKNLERAVWLTAEASMQHLFGKSQLIHPRTVLTRNWFMQAANTHLSIPSH